MLCLNEKEISSAPGNTDISAKLKMYIYSLLRQFTDLTIYDKLIAVAYLITQLYITLEFTSTIIRFKLHFLFLW